jgi:CBS domain-containing protein
MSKKLLVEDVMTPGVATVDPNDKLAVADDVMRLGRVRHMPVVDEEGALVGIVTQRDLFHSGVIRALGYGTHARAQALDALLVKEAMTSPVVTIGPKAPLAEAAQLMLDRKIGCIVVLDGPKILGILTEGDFVKLAVS